MFPKTLALLNQAFRVDVRQLRTHLLRGAVAGAVLWILAMIHDGMRWSSAPGLQFFEVLSWMTLVLLSLTGAFYFPSVITEEKEQQTLGLLRMAGVGARTLLVGKSLGRLSVILLLMTITLPYWWLAVTLGGVTLTQVAASGVILATHLIFMSQIGTLCSVIFKTTGPAAVASAIVIAGLLIGPIVLYEMLRELHVGPAVLQQIQMGYRWIAPGQLELALRSGYNGGVVGLQALVNLAASAVLFCLSWALFDRFNTYDMLEGSTTPLWRRRLDQTIAWGSMVTSGRLFRTHPRRAKGNAILWKDFRFFAGGWLWIGLRVAGFSCLLMWLISLLLYRYWFEDWRRSYQTTNYHFWGWDVGLPLMACATFFAGLEAVYLAAHVFQRELKEQTWDSLRMLPISLRALCGWKIAGCALALVPAVLFYLLGLLFDMAEWEAGLEEFFHYPGNYIFGIGYGVIATVLALYLVCFFSLKTNPWLGIVLASAAFGFTVFSGFFCCLEVLDLDNWNIAFVVFAAQSMVSALLILALNAQFLRMLRGEDAAG